MKYKFLRNRIVLPISCLALSALTVVGFVNLQSTEVNAEGSTPIIWSVSDAVKPGESITLQGAYLSGGENTTVYMAENQAGAAAETPPTNAETITHFLAEDASGEGLVFTFPMTLSAGQYDIWVKTDKGCSNAITLNAARPLYLDQEATYEGLPIEIVGRNLLEHEYGVGDETSALKNAKVKLVSTTNTSLSYVVGVDSEVRYSETESVTGKVVTDSNPYRLTFTTPTAEAGIYDVYVAADGEDFRGLFYPQTLEVKTKKTQSWNTEIFGATTNNTHIGNDPLDLQVYWAQDLNYTNVERMTPFASVPSDTTAKSIEDFDDNLFAAAARLKAQGGGVIYFPAGSYYLKGINDDNSKCVFDNIIFVGAGANNTKIYYADKNNEGTWIRTYASNVGFARMSFEQWDMTDAKKRPDNPIAFFDTASENSDIGAQVTCNKFVTDVKFKFTLADGNSYEDVPVDKDGDNQPDKDANGNIIYNTTTTTNRRCYMSVSGQKNAVIRNIDWYGGNVCFRTGMHRYVKVENMDAEFEGTGSASFECPSAYSTIENVSLKATTGSNGHGFSCRRGIYVGNCHVANVGNTETGGNGEVIMFEPPSGYFSAGTVVSATDNTVTTSRLSGSEVFTDTQLLYNNPAIYIVGGKGAGQLRFLKKLTDKVEDFNETTNYKYEFLDGEKDWDITPDTTSQFTIIAPQDGNTVYRMKAENCVKGIYLYSQMFDTVVAECDLTKTEGILLNSVMQAENGRVQPNVNVRIVNNNITGVSATTNKGGIQIRVHSHAASADNVLFGTAVRGIALCGNTLTDTYPVGSTSTGSEMMPNTCGISIVTQINDNLATPSVGQKVDAKLIVVEGNTVTNAQYGFYNKSFVSDVVVKNNELNSTVEVYEAWAPEVELVEDPVFDGSASLSLDGTIAINVRMDFTDIATPDGYSVAFFIDDKEVVEVAYANASVDSTNANRRYFTCPVAAKEMTQAVVAILKDNGVGVKQAEYTVVKVAETYTTSTDSNLQKLGKAILNYGAYAQQYFGYNTDNLANANLSDEDKTLGDVTIEASQKSEGTAPTSLTMLQATLTLESQTAVRFYYTSAEALTVKLNGKEVQPTQYSETESIYYVEIVLNAVSLNDDITVSLSDGENEFKVTYNAMVYVKNKLSNTDENLVNLVKALYFYNQAAEAYFDSLEFSTGENELPKDEVEL